MLAWTVRYAPRAVNSRLSFWQVSCAARTPGASFAATTVRSCGQSAVYPRAADRFDARLRCVGLLGAAVGRETDVVILNDAPPQLARHILAAGDRLLLNDAAIDHAFRRTTLSRAADLEPFLRRARRVKLQSLDR